MNAALIIQILSTQWMHRKTKKLVLVVEVDGEDIVLRHDTGRVTRKQEHYFFADYDRVSSGEKAEDAQ